MERNRWIHDLIWCADCCAHVPVFRDLGPDETRQLEQWRAKKLLPSKVASITGLDGALAKSWLVHVRKAIVTKGKWNSTKCPSCERWLRGPRAQQCFHCGADWHAAGQ
ncbi:MAG: hypothetical protein ACKVS9_10105 [Phycisphaerae bacterium]